MGRSGPFSTFPLRKEKQMQSRLSIHQKKSKKYPFFCVGTLTLFGTIYQKLIKPGKLLQNLVKPSRDFLYYNLSISA